MNPKNKAIELLDRFAPLAKYWDCYNDEPLEENNAKICALIAQQNLLKKLKELNIEDSFEEQVLFEINVL